MVLNRCFRQKLKLLPFIHLILIFAFGCTIIPSGSDIDSEKDYSGDFNQLWSDVEQNYSYLYYRDINWETQKVKYGQRILKDISYESFINDVCAPMLTELKDMHVRLIDREGKIIPIYSKPYEENYDFSSIFYQTYFGGLVSFSNNGMFTYAEINDSIGYIGINTWDLSLEEDRNQFHLRLENFSEYKGIIIDVRANEGGDENVAQNVAGRFSDGIHTYAWQQYRNGPDSSDLTELQSRSFAPSGDWQYLKPIMLLIGQKCVSANESFILMMSSLDQVTTIGDTTRGSSGGPLKYTMKDGATQYYLPSWVAYKTDKTLLENIGIHPDILIPEDQSIIKDKDLVLEKAIHELTN